MMRHGKQLAVLLLGTALAIGVGAAASAQQGNGGGPGWGQGACGMQGGGQGMGQGGQGWGQGNGQGWGQGQGNCGGMQGGGQGYGQGMGQGRGMMGQGWQGGQPPFMQRFTMIDTNEDGTVSAEEAAEQAEAVFAAMDADQDDEITLEEFLAVDMGVGPGATNPAMAGKRQARREARYASFDLDGNGVVTHAEFMEAHQKQFATADRNKDGKTDPFEFRMMMRQPG